MPCEGIHAAWIKGTQGPRLPALIYFNQHDSLSTPVCEAHILTAYPTDLCLEQQHLVVTPIIKIRAQQPFKNMQEAQMQIAKDKSVAVNFFEKALDKSQLTPA